MKRVGDPTTLSRLWWDGPEPEPGDALETKTGRKYLILKVRGKQLDCMVITKDEKTNGEVFKWEWAKRKSKSQR